MGLSPVRDRTRRPAVTPVPDTFPPKAAGRRSAQVRPLFALTRPRVLELLLVTAIPTMLAAQRGLPPIRVLLVTLVGIALSAASANAIICYLRGHSDAVMQGDFRQVLTAIGRRAIKPGEALTFGIALAAAALTLLGLQVSWLSAALAGTTIMIFVFIDTLRSSRMLHSGTVVGGTTPSSRYGPTSNDPWPTSPNATSPSSPGWSRPGSGGCRTVPASSAAS